MAVSATASNRAKYALARKTIDLQDDSIRAILMRQGFVFNKDNHAIRLNLKGISRPRPYRSTPRSSLDSGNGFDRRARSREQDHYERMDERRNNATKVSPPLRPGLSP